LMALDGVEVFPSQANFILMRVNDAGAVFESLKERGVLIKNMHGQGGLLSQCLRITVGSKDENNAVLAALREIIL